MGVTGQLTWGLKVGEEAEPVVGVRWENRLRYHYC